VEYYDLEECELEQERDDEWETEMSSNRMRQDDQLKGPAGPPSNEGSRRRPEDGEPLSPSQQQESPEHLAKSI